MAEVNHIITSAMLYTYFEFRFNCATLLQTRYTLWQLYVCLSVGRSVGLSVRPSTRPWQRDACIVSNWLNTLPNFFTIQQPDPWTPLLIRYRGVYMHTSYHRPRSSRRLRNRFGLCVCVCVRVSGITAKGINRFESTACWNWSGGHPDTDQSGSPDLNLGSLLVEVAWEIDTSCDHRQRSSAALL